MKIPLFDIDWTLLKGGNKPADDSFGYAIKSVFGIDASISEIIPHGKIDSQIILELLSLHGIDPEEAKPKLDEVYREKMAYFLQHEHEWQSEAMPGSKELLRELKERHNITGVLTGNIEEKAWRKLEKAGLREYIDFGSFGNLAYRRVDLVTLAYERAKALGANIAFHDLVIVGDALLDIACAKEAGIPVIGVATNPGYSFETLQKEGADLVVPSLQETDQILSFLEGSHRRAEFKG